MPQAGGAPTGDGRLAAAGRCLRRLAFLADGRALAGAVLVAWLGIAALDPTPVARLRALGYDVYQTLAPREPTAMPAVVVAIDESSLAAHGQWPWPRSLVAALIDRIAEAGPAAIGLDVVFAEADRYSPAQLAESLPQIDAASAARLAALPGNDALLAEAFRRAGRVVLAKVGTHDPSASKPGDRLGATAPVLETGAPMGHVLPRYADVLRSIDVLEQSAVGWGLINTLPEGDGTVRRVPAAGILEGRVVASLPVEMVRVVRGSPRSVLIGDRGGLRAIDVGAFPIPVDRNGRFRLYHSPHVEARFVSAHEVLAAAAPIDKLRGRFVLVGATAIGLRDFVTTPVEPQLAGVEIHAQILESIVENSFLARPDLVRRAETGFTILGALLLIWLVPALRPGLSFLPLIGLWSALLAAGWIAFLQARVLVDVTAPGIGTGLTFVAMLGMTLILAEQRRRELQEVLQREREAAQMLQGELNAARDIQMGILPRPEDSRLPAAVDLAARLVPARTVGGDLYDFFMIDGSRLFLHAGDVTGKGVPAALFMALSKTLCKSVVLRQTAGMDTIMSQANREIARENTQEMLVTMFAGILDVETGEIGFCNAGHEAPYVLAPGRPPREIESEGGPPLCALEDFDYPLERLCLAPGEMLVIYTDGITEARNEADEMFGRERLAALLAEIDPGAGAAAALQRVFDAVAGFVGAAEASDDITVVVVRWAG